MFADVRPADGIATPRAQRMLSSDGRFAVFSSAAANLIPGQLDANGDSDIFLHDRVSGSVTLVSHAAGTPGTAGNGSSRYPSLSADGRYVAFESLASNLVIGFVEGGLSTESDVYLFDRLSGEVSLVSHATGLAATGGSGRSTFPVISSDGAAVGYVSNADDLVAGFKSGENGLVGPTTDVFVFDRSSGMTGLASPRVGSPITGGAGESWITDLSGGGQVVCFASVAYDLVVPFMPFATLNVYAHDRLTGVTTLVSRSTASPTEGVNSPCFASGSISADGRFVAFETAATNMVAGTSGASGAVYLFDRVSGVTTLVSHTPGSPTANGNGVSNLTRPLVSADASTVIFTSAATDLVNGFVNGNGGDGDVFAFDRTSGAVSLVSRGTAGPINGGNGDSFACAVSDDGRYVSVLSGAGDLVAGFVDGNPADPMITDAYIVDRISGGAVLVSHAAGSAQTGADALIGSALISGDGGWVGFASRARTLAPGVADTNAHDDVFLSDRAGLATAMLSRRAPAAPSLSPAGNTDWAQQSADGRYVTFTSMAANVVPGQVDIEGTSDVFLLDRATHVTVLVSRVAGTAATAAADGAGRGSAIPVISADGRYVAYASYAPGLVAGFVDANGGPVGGTGLYTGTDVFLFDRVSGSNVLVSRQAGTATTGGNLTSATFAPTPDWLVTISDDGRYVGYTSRATDLVTGFVDGNGTTPAGNFDGDCFVFDRVTGKNELVSHQAGAPAVTGNKGSRGLSLSGDGRFASFVGSATDLLLAGQSGVGSGNVFLYDRQSGETALVSHAPGDPAAAVGASARAYLSRAGDTVVFESNANAAGLVAGAADANNQPDVFVYDRLTEAVTLVSHAAGPVLAAGSKRSELSAGQNSTGAGCVSADGRFVTYASAAGDLVAGFVDQNGTGSNDVYLFDRLTGANVLVSRSAGSATAGGDRAAFFPWVSGDGRFVAFVTQSVNLVAGYTGPYTLLPANVYLYDHRTGLVGLASRSTAGPAASGNGDSNLPTISHDGSAVLFLSYADNLAAGDFNGFADAFALVTPPPRVQSVQVADGSAQRSVVRSLTVTFDQPVFFAGAPDAAFALTRIGPGASGSVTLAVGNVTANACTLTFTGLLTEFGSLIDGIYQLKVLASQVSNIGQLDGNGDGVGGDDYTFNFHRLFGDADGDRTVGPLDFAALRVAFGSPSLAFDFDNDGDADAADFFQFRRRFGVTL